MNGNYCVNETVGKTIGKQLGNCYVATVYM